jgi:aerobic-type carbon monoxide dehydrogenase small subunit (CoxS/CutS family)
MAKKQLVLRVNGEDRRVTVEPDEPLLWVLRDRLNLTGCKFGCGMGHCGACSVLIDREAWRSCLVPAEAVAEGQEIVTIEGLGRPGNLSPVQRAFLEHTAFGCGFCTPGMIVNATALLLANSQPTTDQIVAAMDESLCRCASYPSILEAIGSLASSGEKVKV